MQEVELPLKFKHLICKMKLADHAVPGDATFYGEVSGRTFWYVRTEQLLISRSKFIKSERGVVTQNSRKMLKERSAPGASYKYKQRTCRNKGCSKVLKRDQLIACSDKCVADLRYTCLTIISNLGITAEDYDNFLKYGT